MTRLAPQLGYRVVDDRIVPALMNWTGGPLGLGTNWFDAGNWDIVGSMPVQHAVPGIGDDAILSAQNAGGPGTVFVNGAAGVRSLNMVRNLSISGSFTMGGGIFNYGNYKLDGGTLDILDGSNLQNLTIAGAGSLPVAAGRTVSLFATTISEPTCCSMAGSIASISARGSSRSRSVIRMAGLVISTRVASSASSISCESAPPGQNTPST